jgi:hypothetical protein
MDRFIKLSRPRSHALLDRFAKINRESYSEIGHKRLRYWQRIRTRKVRVGIVGAAHLHERAFGYACQLREALDRNLRHRRLILPEALDGVPGHGEGAGVLDVNVHFEHLAITLAFDGP